MPKIVQARPEDAATLSQLEETTFRDTFGAVNTAENMRLHCQASYREAIQAREIADPGLTILLAKEDERLVGFVQLRWAGAPACIAARNPGEIQRLYVARDWHGRGVAQSLMQAALAEVRRRGSDVVWLGVWEHNPRALAFYRKFGFVEVGEQVFRLGTDPQRDIVMARSVEAGEVAPTGNR